MKSFSVLTVSVRTGWEDIANQSVRAQTAQPEAWYLVSPLYESFNKCNATPIQEPKKTKLSNLNAALNEGLRFINTDYVIFYQDYISLDEDCFQKLLDLADEDTFVTTCTPNYDGSNDGRWTNINDVRECEAREWEANVAIAPMGVIKELGGFDEDYDNAWSWDNVNLAERAEMLGCKFLIDETNRPTLYPHDKPKDLPLNGDFHAQTMEAILLGKKPLKLNYL